MENNGMRSYTLLLSGFCSLMLGSTLLTAQAGMSMAAVGAAGALSNQVASYGVSQSAQADVERSSPKVIKVSASFQSAELEPVVAKLESDGKDGTLADDTVKLVGLGNSALPMKAKGLKKGSETRIVGLVRSGDSAYLVLLQMFPDHNYVFLTAADGQLRKGFFVDAAGNPSALTPNEPTFGAQKQFWKSQFSVTVAANTPSAS